MAELEHWNVFGPQFALVAGPYISLLISHLLSMIKHEARYHTQIAEHDSSLLTGLEFLPDAGDDTRLLGGIVGLHEQPLLHIGWRIDDRVGGD